VEPDGLAGLLAISENTQRALGDPTGYDLNHLQGQFGTGAILLGVGLTDLVAPVSRFWRERADWSGACGTGGPGRGRPSICWELTARQLAREDHEVVVPGRDFRIRACKSVIRQYGKRRRRV
jgi:hypothetical protein